MDDEDYFPPPADYPPRARERKKRRRHYLNDSSLTDGEAEISISPSVSSENKDYFPKPVSSTPTGRGSVGEASPSSRRSASRRDLNAELASRSVRERSPTSRWSASRRDLTAELNSQTSRSASWRQSQEKTNIQTWRNSQETGHLQSLLETKMSHDAMVSVRKETVKKSRTVKKIRPAGKADEQVEEEESKIERSLEGWSIGGQADAKSGDEIDRSATQSSAAGFTTPSKSDKELLLSMQGSPRLEFWDGDNWKYSPRTGYTYALSLTYRDSVTPGREIPMPHMARWPIHHRGDRLQFTSSSSSSRNRHEAHKRHVGGRTRRLADMPEFSDSEDDIYSARRNADLSQSEVDDDIRLPSGSGGWFSSNRNVAFDRTYGRSSYTQGRRLITRVKETVISSFRWSGSIFLWLLTQLVLLFLLPVKVISSAACFIYTSTCNVTTNLFQRSRSSSLGSKHNPDSEMISTDRHSTMSLSSSSRPTSSEASSSRHVYTSTSSTISSSSSTHSTTGEPDTNMRFPMHHSSKEASSMFATSYLTVIWTKITTLVLMITTLVANPVQRLFSLPQYLRMDINTRRKAVQLPQASTSQTEKEFNQDLNYLTEDEDNSPEDEPVSIKARDEVDVARTSFVATFFKRICGYFSAGSALESASYLSAVGSAAGSYGNDIVDLPRPSPSSNIKTQAGGDASFVDQAEMEFVQRELAARGRGRGADSLSDNESVDPNDENRTNELIESTDSFSFKTIAMKVVQCCLLPVTLTREILHNTWMEIVDYYKPKPVLRRSRRLQGLPPEVVEELKRVRRIRKAQKQLAAGKKIDSAAIDNDDSDSDDERILEKIEKRKVAQARKVSLFSIMSKMIGSLYRKKGTRRSRRLRGLTPEMAQGLQDVHRTRSRRARADEDEDAEEMVNMDISQEDLELLEDDEWEFLPVALIKDLSYFILAPVRYLKNVAFADSKDSETTFTKNFSEDEENDQNDDEKRGSHGKNAKKKNLGWMRFIFSFLYRKKAVRRSRRLQGLEPESNEELHHKRRTRKSKRSVGPQEQDSTASEYLGEVGALDMNSESADEFEDEFEFLPFVWFSKLASFFWREPRAEEGTETAMSDIASSTWSMSSITAKMTEKLPGIFNRRPSVKKVRFDVDPNPDESPSMDIFANSPAALEMSRQAESNQGFVQSWLRSVTSYLAAPAFVNSADDEHAGSASEPNDDLFSEKGAHFSQGRNKRKLSLFSWIWSLFFVKKATRRSRRLDGLEPEFAPSAARTTRSQRKAKSSTLANETDDDKEGDDHSNDESDEYEFFLAPIFRSLLPWEFSADINEDKAGHANESFLYSLVSFAWLRQLFTGSTSELSHRSNEGLVQGSPHQRKAEAEDTDNSFAFSEKLGASRLHYGKPGTECRSESGFFSDNRSRRKCLCLLLIPLILLCGMLLFCHQQPDTCTAMFERAQNTSVKVVNESWVTIKQGTTSAANIFVDLVQHPISAFQMMPAAFQQTSSYLYQSIANGFGNLGDVSTSFAPLIQKVANSIYYLPVSIYSGIEHTFQYLAKWFSSIFNYVSESLIMLMSHIWESAKLGIKAMWSLGAAVIATPVGLLENMSWSLPDMAVGAYRMTTDLVCSVGNMLLDLGATCFSYLSIPFVKISGLVSTLMANVSESMLTGFISCWDFTKQGLLMPYSLGQKLMSAISVENCQEFVTFPLRLLWSGLQSCWNLICLGTNYCYEFFIVMIKLPWQFVSETLPQTFSFNWNWTDGVFATISSIGHYFGDFFFGLYENLISIGAWILSFPISFGSWLYVGMQSILEGLTSGGSYIMDSLYTVSKIPLAIPKIAEAAGSGLIHASRSAVFNLFHLLTLGWLRSSEYIFSSGGTKHGSGPSTAQLDYDAIVEKVIASQRFSQVVEEIVESKTGESVRNITESLQASQTSVLGDFDAKLKLNIDSMKEDLKLVVQDLTLEMERTKQGVESELEIKKQTLQSAIDKLKSKEEEFTVQMQNIQESQRSDVKPDNEGLDSLRQEIENLRIQIDRLNSELEQARLQMSNCCQNETVLLETVESFLYNLTEGKAPAKLNDQMAAWLHKYFVSRTELEDKIKEAGGKTQVEESITKEPSAKEGDAMARLVDEVTEKVKLDILANLPSSVPQPTGQDNAMLNRDDVLKLIQTALIQYDADKTGMFDYALETAGGSVVSTRCTETYVQKTALYSIFGIPLWYPSNNPRTLIQPGVQPGQCWAFKGSSGYVVIQLSEPIRPTQFSIEHIAKSMSPSGKIDSAPKDFVVFGLRAEKDPEPVLLGQYTYNQDGLPLQYFEVEFPSEQSFPYIELDINSNHGNMNYTCLYRFRVHGRPRV